MLHPHSVWFDHWLLVANAKMFWVDKLKEILATTSDMPQHPNTCIHGVNFKFLHCFVFKLSHSQEKLTSHVAHPPSRLPGGVTKPHQPFYGSEVKTER